MRFRKSLSPAPFLNTRHQRRLLLMFGLLALVLIAMRIAAKPSTWNWMFVGQAKTGAAPTNKSDANQPTRPLAPDEFRAEPRSGSTNAIAVGRNDAAAGKADSDDANLALDRRHFAKVEDRTYPVRAAELEGYYAVLARVAKLPQEPLEELAKRNGPVPFSVLRNEPAAHRGRAITVEGKLGSLRLLPDPRPDLGLKTLYEAWIVTTESDNNPYRVVFSELPAGLTPQDRFSDPPLVRATGYFFKVQNYEVKPGDDQSHTAPLLLGRRIRPIPAAPEQPGGAALASYVIGFALLLGAVLAVFVWRFSTGDKQFAETQLSRFDPSRAAPAPDLKHLETAEDPQEFFRRLGEADAAAEAGNQGGT